MLRFTIVGHKEYREKVIQELRKTGIAEINFACPLPEETKEIPEISLTELELRIAQLQFFLNFLSSYTNQALPKVKIVISETQVSELSNNYSIENIYNLCKNLSFQIENIKQSIADNNSNIRNLQPWETLNYSLSEFVDSENITFIFCSCKKKTFNELKLDIKDNFYDILWQIEYKKIVHFIVAVLKTDQNKVSNIIRQLDITTHKLTNFKETPSSVILNLHKDIILKENSKTQPINQMDTIAKNELEKIMILHDHYNELYKIKQAEKKLKSTAQTFLLNGWLSADQENQLCQKLVSISEPIEFYTREPHKDEIPPVVLKNKKLISPFEFLTTLFDRPQYTEFDPTPLFTPFFVVFFALCVSDIFYGIISITAGLIGLRILSKKQEFDPDSGLCKILRILLICGLLTSVAGILTDSFAGFPISGIFSKIKRFVLINPLQEPVKMLVLSLLLGVIQLVFGMLIKLVKNIKEKDFLAVIDQIIWIGLFTSVVPLAYEFMFGKIISENINNISKSVFPVSGILFLVFVFGRKIITKPLDTIPVLFGITGLFGDIMSYSRIFGLALSGTVIAQIINQGVKSLSSGSYVGYVPALLLFVFGHSVNFLMNLLGAFVHSARLQFLEFFMKFFDGGGKPFQPFCEQRKYSIIT